MEEPTLPFPVVWRVQLASAANTPFAPLIGASSVVSRSGHVVVSARVDDGAPSWTCTLPARSGAGELLVRAGERVLTLRIRRPENLASLVAVDANGAIAWDVPLGALVAREGVVFHHGRVVVAAIVPGSGGEWIELDAETGEIVERRRSALGGGLTAIDGGLLVRDETADAKRAGLTRVADDGASETLAKGACWMADVRAGKLVFLVRVGTRGDLRVRDPDGRVEHWSRAVVASTADADDEHVITVEETAGKRLLVLRDLASGDEIWRTSTHTSEEIGKVVLAGPVVAALALDGWRYVRRADGELIGQAETGLGPPSARGDRLYFAAPGQLVCTRSQL